EVGQAEQQLLALPDVEVPPALESGPGSVRGGVHVALVGGGNGRQSLAIDRADGLVARARQRPTPLAGDEVAESRLRRATVVGGAVARSTTGRLHQLGREPTGR